MNFLHTIRFRFTLWYLAILSVLLIGLGCGIYFTLSNVLRNNLDHSLLKRAEQLSEYKDIISIVAGGTFEGAQGEFISFYFYSEERLRHISYRSAKAVVNRKLIESAFSGKSSFTNVGMPNLGLFRIYITPFTPDNPEIRPDRFGRQEERPPRNQWNEDRPPGKPRHGRRPERDRGPKPPPDKRIVIHKAALVIARPAGYIGDTLQRLLHILFAAVPLTLAFSGAGGLFLARRAFKPVEDIANTANRIGESDLSHRIDVETKDELGNLAATLNRMIARLERAFERQKEFTGDASHELRAPLSIIQAEATLALRKERPPGEYRKALEVISSEADHMASLTNQLLELARADSGKEKYMFETLELAEFMKEVCSDMAILCQEKGLVLKLDLPEQSWISGDQKSLRRLMYNILNNAIRYTDHDGTIGVVLQKKHDAVMISVSDTGIGITEDQLTFIYERFYRADKARSRSEGGSGLGLAICKHIVDRHGGRIDVESRLGRGSTFSIQFPIKAPQSRSLQNLPT
ncbi:MAG: HAMP domain-containing histidine kinase [Desulfobacteraceae bacterium]|nr:HAMP domain-containing histidine kinase [Desulfobacteraceae bacterium]